MKQPQAMLRWVGLFWLFLVVVGFVGMIVFATTPGESAKNLKMRWPSPSGIITSGTRALVVFIHPLCSCSLATLGELETLANVRDRQLEINIVFTNVGHEFSKNNFLRQKAEAIVGADNFYIDTDNIEANLFGAKTSGQSFLYENGNLVFEGGITQGRGHIGENSGRLAILSEIENDLKFTQSKVYGCDLAKSDQNPTIFLPFSRGPASGKK